MGQQLDVPSLARQILNEQQIGVLASSTARGPHLSLVAFAALFDDQVLYFATSRSSRKFANLEQDPRAAFLVDDRGRRVEDLHRAVAVTVQGSAREVDRTSRAPALSVYLERHPHLIDFVQAPSCALMEMSMGAVEVVQAFQQVTRISFNP